MTLHSSGPDSIHSYSGVAADPSKKLKVLVEALEETAENASEWQKIISKVDELTGRGNLATMIGDMGAAATPGAKFVLAVLLEKSGQYASAARVLDEFYLGPTAELEVLRLNALARNNVLGGDFSAAISPLRRAVRLTESYRSLSTSARILNMMGELTPKLCKRTVRLAIIGNATHALSLSHLRAAAFSYGINLELFAGAYGQHAQEILNPSSNLWAFRPEIVLIAANTHSLDLAEESTNPDTAVCEYTKEIVGLWSACLRALPCTVIQHNFVVPEVSPLGRLSNTLPGGRARLIRRLNLELETAAAGTAGVVILDVEQIASLVGKRLWDDDRMWIQAKQYPGAAATSTLVKHQAALIRAILGMTSKCVVLDLDNTLWGGIIGEDGLNGIQLGGSPKGEAYKAFQRYLVGLHQRGIILAVCSKNNESDALQPFEKHPEMLLKQDHISIFVANWVNKSENLLDIARRLNVGLDSLVFVDDNPIERELVRKELPDIEVPELPPDPALFAVSLHRELLFESISLTAEDRQRTESYKANLERQALQSSSSSLEDFLRGLRMHAKLRRFDSVNEPRIVQLINKTNQFNLTTVRMSEAEVRAYASSKDNYTQFLQLSDRFGDSGIVGVLMASPDGEALRIDQWLMSCRILGRNAENVMLSGVWNYARHYGYRKLIGIFNPTGKNAQVANVYDRLGFSVLHEQPNGSRYYEVELSDDMVPPAFLTIEDRTSMLSTVGDH